MYIIYGFPRKYDINQPRAKYRGLVRILKIEENISINKNTDPPFYTDLKCRQSVSGDLG